MRERNVKRELVFAAKWLFGMLMLLMLVSVMKGQGVQASVPKVQQVKLPDYVRTPRMGIQEQFVRLPNWNGIAPMFHPSPVLVFMDEPVDVAYIRRNHTGYQQIGPKLWLRVGGK